MKKMILILTLILLSSISYSCKVEDVDIYTSVYALTYITNEIVEDKLNVKSIYPNNVEVHDYEPSPKNIVKMVSSDVIFYIGQGLEPFIEDGISTTFKDTLCVKMTSFDSIPLVCNDGGSDHDHDHGDYEYDPHIWLDPHILIEMTNIILNTLLSIEKYSQYEDVFKENASKLISSFTTIKDEYDYLHNYSGKTIIVDHNAYKYISSRYNLNIKSLRGDNQSSDPNSKEFINIINYALENKIKYILATKNEQQESLLTSYINQLKSKDNTLNPAILYLNNLERNTDEDFIEILEENLRVFKKTLENQN